MIYKFFIKFIYVLLVSIVAAIAAAILGYWVFEWDWAFLPVPVLAGVGMALVQRERKSYKFIDKLLVGSLLFGILASFLVYLRMYLILHPVEPTLPLIFNKKDFLISSLIFSFVSFLGGLAGIVFKGFYFILEEKIKKLLLKLNKQKIVIFITLSTLFIILATIFSISSASDKNDSLLEAMSVINLGVTASRDQATLVYNQDNYIAKCQMVYGINTENCKNAMDTLDIERNQVSLSADRYYNSWKVFSAELDANSSKYFLFRQDTWTIVFLLLAFMFTTISTLSQLKRD